MKLLFLTNNEITNSLYFWLNEQKSCEIKKVHKKITLNYIKNYKPDLIICYNYRFIIKNDIISYMDGKIINLHISYLPWNKGAHPNVWSILENTPKGVTIHQIDAHIDTGKILLQKIVKLNTNEETLLTSYEKLHKEIQNLFIENWTDIKNWNVKLKKQNNKGTYHLSSEFKKIEFLINDKGWDINLNKFKKDYNNYKYNRE